MTAKVVAAARVTFHEAATCPACSIVILCGQQVLATIDQVPTDNRAARIWHQALLCKKACTALTDLTRMWFKSGYFEDKAGV